MIEITLRYETMAQAREAMDRLEAQEPQLRAGPVTEEEAYRAVDLNGRNNGFSTLSAHAVLTDFLTRRAAGARP